jgi:hypothetical protein
MWEHMVARHRAEHGGPSDGQFNEKISEYLSLLGRQGWELAGATTVNDGTLVIFFKRRAVSRPQPDAERPPDGLTLGYL